MKIVVKQQGGFAGIERVVAEADTRNLQKEQAEQLRKRVDDLDFFGGFSPEEPAVGADLMQYEVTISDGSRRKTVLLTDHPDTTGATDSGAQKLRSLVDWLQTL